MTDLEYIIVEGSKGQEGRGAGGSVEEVRVDAVVALVKRDSDAAVVDPRARLESLGSGDADVWLVLSAPIADAVVEIVGVAHLGDVGGPGVVSAREVDHGAGWEGGA
jgi:hypothetical protein